MYFADALQRRIENEYRARGDCLGWRFLYSPVAAIYGARVAFIGLNPGGDRVLDAHSVFSMEAGSAYFLEDWGAGPGNSPLQRQVLAVFNSIGEDPANVLAGNLVPFRSPSWAALRRKRDAVSFGVSVWSEILARAKPRLIIGMGSVVIRSIQRLLEVGEVEDIPLGWGNVKARHAQFVGGIFIGLPHLSRFQVMGRPQSCPGIERLFGAALTQGEAPPMPAPGTHWPLSGRVRQPNM